MKNLFESLVICTKNYLEQNNIKSMVLGISGGIDSTVVAVICNEINKRNPELKLIGVSLPSNTNEDPEIKTAKLVGESFCNIFQIQPIQGMFDYFIKNSSGIQKQTPLANGNIKARLRMIYLYNIAGLNKGIVMSTGNLTETYTGFWTIHGDEGDLGPIETLYKHQVYKLADWMIKNLDLSDGQKEAVKESMKLIPTDGNGVMAGGDLAQIAPGHTYNEVDRILNNIINVRKVCGKDWDQHLDEFIGIRVVKDLYGEDTVMKLVERIKRSEFKRKHRPLVINKDSISEFIS